METTTNTIDPNKRMSNPHKGRKKEQDRAIDEQALKTLYKLEPGVLRRAQSQGFVDIAVGTMQVGRQRSTAQRYRDDIKGKPAQTTPVRIYRRVWFDKGHNGHPGLARCGDVSVTLDSLPGGVKS